MSLFLVCAAGHRWSAGTLEPPLSSDSIAQCPTCGAGAVSHILESGSLAAESNPSSATAPGCNSQHFLAPLVPGYEMLSVLGTGAMGIVFQALHLQTNRMVALKMILSGKDASAMERQRFLTESEAVGRLNHPNIVKIHETGEYEGNIYLVLELVNGGNLARRIAGQAQPIQPSARLVEQLAQAMHYAHQSNILHRDLKPGNVLLSASGASPNDLGTPKIIDFGLAKRLEVNSNLTQTGQVLGTPNYMPPEQAAGLSKHLTPAADVYSLGAILYHLLTGRPPFKGDSAMHTLKLIRIERAVAPRRLNPNVPDDLETICLTCFEKEPGRRYASAAALAEDLRRFLDGQPIQARALGEGEVLCH